MGRLLAAGAALALFLATDDSLPAQTFAQAPAPQGITPKRLIFLPNALQDANGNKPNFTAPTMPRPPLRDMWLVSEHGFAKTGPNRYLLVSMENNYNFLVGPGAGFVEAFNFVQWTGDFINHPGLPQTEKGYWRGDVFQHRYVWAPFVFEDGGTYYLFYPAPYPDPTGPISCFLATSTTGNPDPADWHQYDPDPDEPGIQPLFGPHGARGYRDFSIVKVNTPFGVRYYNYYISDVYDASIDRYVSETWLRATDNLLNWPVGGELTTPVFRRVNSDTTLDGRYHVDYENPFVVQYDADNFYLFISRHGIFPADMATNPDWKVIPMSTEVYWSPDGLKFEVANQMPNLETVDHLAINSAEIFTSDGRWFATDATYSNDFNDIPFDSCPGAGVEFTCYSPGLTRVVQQFQEPDHSLHLVEFKFEHAIPAEEFPNAWMCF
ncbi:hypothetical protein BH09SUM1_BH09SUM1_20080 [soil metagenome]